MEKNLPFFQHCAPFFPKKVSFGQMVLFGQENTFYEFRGSPFGFFDTMRRFLERNKVCHFSKIGLGIFFWKNKPFPKGISTFLGRNQSKGTREFRRSKKAFSDLGAAFLAQ